MDDFFPLSWLMATSAFNPVRASSSTSKGDHDLPEHGPVQYPVIDELPDEILLLIVRTVSSQQGWGVPTLLCLSEVSRRFYRIARDPLLWRYLLLRDCPDDDAPSPDHSSDSSGGEQSQPVPKKIPKAVSNPLSHPWRKMYLAAADRYRDEISWDIPSEVDDPRDVRRFLKFSWAVESVVGVSPDPGFDLNELNSFHKLEDLSLEACEELVSFGSLRLPTLRTLNLKAMPLIQDFGPYGLLARFPELRDLNVDTAPCFSRLDLLPQTGVPFPQAEHYWEYPMPGKIHPLESISLRECSELSLDEDPGFPLIRLKRLRLDDLPSVLTFPESFGQMSMLTLLALLNLENITNFPDNFSGLLSLAQIDLHTLPSLEGPIPLWMSKLPCLTSFKARSCPNLHLGSITAEVCSGWSSSLETLELAQCGNSLTSLPHEFGMLSKLSALTFVDIPIRHLPSSLRSLSRFTFSNLLDPDGSLLRSLSHLPSLGFIDLMSLHGTSAIPALDSLTCLSEMRIKDFPDLIDFDNSLPDSLELLSLTKCPHLQHLPLSLTGLSNLCALTAIDCSELHEMFPVSQGPKTRDASVELHQYDEHLHFQGLQNLTRLVLHHCPSLQKLPSSITLLTILERLWLDDATLTSLPAGIGDMTALKDLRLIS